VIARLFVILALAFFAVAPRVSAQGGVDTAEASTVRVALILEQGGARSLYATGSGWVVAPNLIVTNAHVVAPARNQPGIGLGIVAPEGDGMIPARIVSYSALSDLALIEFRGGARLNPLPVSIVEPRAGDAIIALGYPDVDDLRQDAEDLLRPVTPSRTSGAIASLRDRAPTGDPVPTINHEAVISSGSSGGPLLDECGRVIGVNTWHARGRDTIESRGVALRAAPLIDFLQDAGVNPEITEERCLSVTERVEAERASTLSALAAQNRELADKLEAADRLTRIALVILLGGTVGLLVAVIVLGAIVFGRHAHPHPADPPHLPGPMRRGAPGVLVVVAGATIAAVLVVSAGLALWRMRALSVGELGAAQVFAGLQTCDLDPEQSSNVGEDDQPARFTGSGDLCINGRTLYAPASDARRYQRLVFNGRSGTVDVLTLEPRGAHFSRERFALTAQQRRDIVTVLAKTPDVACDQPGARAALRRRNDALARFAKGQERQRLVWRCARAAE